MTTPGGIRVTTSAHTDRAITRRAGGAVAAVTVLLALLSWSSPASAHTPHDNVVDVERSPDFAEDSTAYAIVRDYLLKTTDGGDSWHRLHRGLDNKSPLSSIEVDQQDGDRLYAASRGDGVYRSDDAGRSWRRAAPPPKGRLNVKFLWVSPHDGDQVFAAPSSMGLSTTSDGGASWRTVPEFDGVAVLSMAFDADRPRIAYAGTEDGLLWSTDGGSTWDEVADVAGPVQAVHVVRGSDDVLVGTDAGLSRVRGGEVERIDDDLDDPNITDIEATGDGRLLAVSWTEGPYVSEDGGESWELRDEGTSTTPMAGNLGHPDFSVVAASPDDDVVLLAGYDGLFRSVDAGGSWEHLVTQDAMNITALAVSPNYAEDGTVLVTTYINGPKLSTDRGETWESLTAGMAFEYDYLRAPDYYGRLMGSFFAPDFATTGRIHTMARGYLFSTEDPGVAPWEPMVVEALVEEGKSPPDHLVPASSPVADADRTQIFGTNSGLLLRQDGAGALERFAAVDEEILALVVSPAFADDETYFAATAGSVYRGTGDADPEVVWEAPNDITSLAVSPAFPDDGTVFVGTRKGLFVTRDAGATWNEVRWTTGAVHPYVESVVLAPSYAEDGFALVSERGHGLARSTDGGRTWQRTGEDLLDRNVVLNSFYHPTGEPIAFSPAFAEDRTVFGTSETDLYRSTDAGETWTLLEIPRSTHPLTEESAPNELLREAHSSHGGHGGRGTDDGAEPNPFSPKRMAAALLAGVAVVVGLSLAGLGKARGTVARWAIRVGPGLVTVAVALILLDLR